MGYGENTDLVPVRKLVPPLVLNYCFKEDSCSADSWRRRDQSLNTPKWLFQSKDNIGGIAVGNFLRKSQLVKHQDYRQTDLELHITGTVLLLVLVLSII